MSSLTTTFSSDKESLQDILASVGKGKTQLPDFQRGWVWDDEHIRSLLASISLSYPVGAVMMLETGGQSVKFKPRLVEGLELPSPIQPERLILDGQQRLTSFFRSLYLNKPVETTDVRKHPIKRWYYLDIRKAINKNVDRDDAIVALPEDKKLRFYEKVDIVRKAGQRVEGHGVAACNQVSNARGMEDGQKVFEILVHPAPSPNP